MPKRFWMKNRNQYWWEETVNKHFKDEDWIETFRMKKSTFQYIYEQLRPMLEPAEPLLKPPFFLISEEKSFMDTRPTPGREGGLCGTPSLKDWFTH